MTLLEKGFDAIARSMREFGYPNTSAADIKRYHEDWLAKKEPSDIVARFAIGNFEDEDYRHIFTEQPK